MAAIGTNVTKQAELDAVLPENREIFARVFQNSDSDSDLENVDPEDEAVLLTIGD